MTGRWYPRLLLTFALAVAACGAPTSPGPSGRADDAAARAARTLNLGVRYEIGELAAKWSTGITSGATKRLFNAGLTLVDGRGAIRPYLADTVPQLNTDAWRVIPGGSMETVYRLKPGLVWHDGTPVTAGDFVLAWRIYTYPGLGIFGSSPQDRMELVTASDERTMVIRWRSLYPEANQLGANELAPLPRYILGDAFAAMERDPASQEGFVNHPYWSREFVGVGPYRLKHWEPGSHVEAEAFDQHALGRPYIDRIVVRFIADENTMLTNLLAHNVDVALDNSLRYEHAVVVKREWQQENRGEVQLDPVQPRLTNIQLRPEYANPSAVLDVRVRRALAHSLDKQGMIDGLFEGGDVPLADQFLPRTVPYFQELDRAIAKYPYDSRRTEELMGEAGSRKGADGSYIGRAGERFAFEHWVVAGSQNERQGAIMADGWRRAGFEVREYAIPTAQSTDGQVRATFPALSSVATGGGESGLSFLAGESIPTPANRWRGNNRGGWSNPEYDRLWDAFQSTLDRSERNRQVIQMMRLATEDVAMLFLFHNPNVTAFWAALRGPEIGAPETATIWNVHLWELT